MASTGALDLESRVLVFTAAFGFPFMLCMGIIPKKGKNALKAN